MADLTFLYVLLYVYIYETTTTVRNRPISSPRKTPSLQSHLPPTPHPWQPWSLLSHYGFVFSRVSYKWSHFYDIICNLLRLASFTRQNTFEIPWCCGLYQLFVSFYCWVLFHFMQIPQCVYVFPRWRISGLFLAFDNYEKTYYKHSCTVFLCKHSFHLCGVNAQ